MSEHQFRNTMFGGFNRQDVLDFLTSSAEKNNQELQRQRESYEALEKDLATAREDREANPPETNDSNSRPSKQGGRLVDFDL